MNTHFIILLTHFTGFLSDVYSAAADELGKIYLIADERVQGAVFDLPDEIAKELLKRQIPPGNSISKISKLPPLQDDGPVSDNYGRFSARDRSSRRGGSFGGRGGGGGRGCYRCSSRGGWGGGRDSSDGDDDFRSSRGSFNRTSSSRPRMTRSMDDDWLIGGTRTGQIPSRDSSRSFGGSCFNCGQSGHRASECPSKKQGY